VTREGRPAKTGSGCHNKVHMGGTGRGVPCAGAEGQQLESRGSRPGAGHRQADPVAQDQEDQYPAAQARRQIRQIKKRPERRVLLARHPPNKQNV